MEIDYNSIGINSVDSTKPKVKLCTDPKFYIQDQTQEMAKPNFKRGLQWSKLAYSHNSAQTSLKDFIEGIGKISPKNIENVWTEYQVNLPDLNKFHSYQKKELQNINKEKDLELAVKMLENNIILDPFLPLVQKEFKISALSEPAIYETQSRNKNLSKIIASVAYSIIEAKTGEETVFRKIFGVTYNNSIE